MHGDLQEDVYVEIPLGVPSPNPNKACKLLKSLYGLKQVSRQWFGKLTSLLIDCGYTQSSSGHSLFLKITNSHTTTLLIYVDDIILAGSSLKEFDFIKQILDQNFKIKDLGLLRFFLGLEVAYSRTGIFLSQRQYCLNLISNSGLLGAKPTQTPANAGFRLSHDRGQCILIR